MNRSILNPLYGRSFVRVVADRDVRPEPETFELSMEPNGVGVTNVIRDELTMEGGDRTLIEDDFLEALNSLLFPDATFERIVPLRLGHKDPRWELNLKPRGEALIPLSQMGSGLRTLIIVLANLLVRPQKENKKLSDYVFGFEELENNLHPSVQRQLFRYLRQVAVEHSCPMVITTHSNVVIDLFSSDAEAQILHVTSDQEGAGAVVRRVESSSHGRHILDDLGVRASDLLQTNAVVWVEGPSDIIYFNRWIELWCEGEEHPLLPGVHYQCVPYGGSVGTFLSLGDMAADAIHEVVDELIAGLRVNRHAVFLGDSDRHVAGAPLKEHVQRIIQEIDEAGGYAWVTDGREVENYVPVETLGIVLEKSRLQGPGKFSDVLDYVRHKEGLKTKRRKTDFAKAVSLRLTREALLHHLDMGTRLDEVCARIREWNGM